MGRGQRDPEREQKWRERMARFEIVSKRSDVDDWLDSMETVNSLARVVVAQDVLGFVPKHLTQDSQVSTDECELEHASVVFRSLLESRKDAATFFQPADQSFDDVPISVGVAVEFDSASLVGFVVFRGNDRLNLAFEQMLIDPVRPISLVTCQLNGPSHGFVVVVDHPFLGPVEQRLDRRGLVGLAGREMKVKWMAVLVTQQMDLGGKTPARAA